MSSTLNLVNDSGLVFNGVVNSVEFYHADSPNSGQLAGVAGTLGKSAVSIAATPKTLELIDGNKHQLGYELKVEITSEQLYSAYEFDKLRNRKCYIALPDVPLWVMPVILNVEITFNPGEGKGQVKITGSKYSQTLVGCVAPNWNGVIAAPFSRSVTMPGEQKIPVTGFEYEYLLSLSNPDVEFIAPAVPDDDDEITELKLMMMKALGEKLTTPPTGTTLKKWNGTAWTSLTDFTVVFEDGNYKVSFSGETGLALGDLLKVTYS